MTTLPKLAGVSRNAVGPAYESATSTWIGKRYAVTVDQSGVGHFSSFLVKLASVSVNAYSTEE